MSKKASLILEFDKGTVTLIIYSNGTWDNAGDAKGLFSNDSGTWVIHDGHNTLLKSEDQGQAMLYMWRIDKPDFSLEGLAKLFTGHAANEDGKFKVSAVDG